MRRMDVQKLVDDYGGAASIAEICDVWRTAPYSWVKRRYVSSRILERLKTHDPTLDIDGYFYDEDQVRRSNGVTRPGLVSNPDTT